MSLIGRAGAAIVANTYAMNAQVLAFVSEGERPHIETANQNAGTINFASATLTGYIVDAP